MSTAAVLLTDRDENTEEFDEEKNRKFSKLLFEKGVLKPCFSYLPLPLAIILWLPVVGLPLLDVLSDINVIGNLTIEVISEP